MTRRAGVLLPISSLPNGYSVGGFGEECKHFIDFLAKAGFSVWQTLPFCLPDECHSPYKSFSAFSGNPDFISLPRLAERGLLTPEELANAREHVDYTCEFARLREERFALLSRAAGRLRDRRGVLGYVRKHPEVDLFCRFMALRAANGDRGWWEWTTDVYDPELWFAWAFSQYEFDREWREVRAYAHARGVSLVGDIPIYVAYDSADVWAHPDLFDLDAGGRMKSVAGVPPDYFAADGQLWGNPLYRWDVMARDGYDWWKRRLRSQLRWFDAVRLDHFRGFASFWKIPAGAASAREGKWCRGPGEDLTRALSEAAGKSLLIAEDLGALTPDVPRLLEACGFPGMRVFQFGFAGDVRSHHMPCYYPPHCVAYSGTHDNNTLLGFVWEMDSAERRRLMAYLGCEGATWEEAVRVALRTLYASAAETVIFPLQDLFGFGADTRLNRPGSSLGNWGFRFSQAQMESLDPAPFARWADLFGRR